MAAQAIPEMLGTITVPAAQVDRFESVGHTVVRGLASPDEIAAFRPAIEDAVRRATTRARPLDERDTYGRAFLQVPNLCASDTVVRAFTFAARFARVAVAGTRRGTRTRCTGRSTATGASRCGCHSSTCRPTSAA